MCGIAGIADVTGALRPDEALVRAMCDTLTHRGPDGAGYHARDGVAIGMRRLAIIDVAGGNQPIFNEDGDVATVFNGEIYNFRELRAELERAGHRFATRSDTEVIVHGYEEWGEGVFERLNGMFGIALFDRRKRALVLARDHAGIKPLYYAWNGRTLVFGSEVKALLASGLVERELDLEALRQFMAWEYVPCPATLLRDVRKLPPATWWRLELDTGRVREGRYWQVPAPESGERLTDDEWIERVDATLAAAVRRQMVSDVPLGAFLSGGVDSSLLVASMGGGARTFSIGFEDPSYNELEHSRRVAEHLGVNHATEVIREDSLALFDDLLELMDDPIGDSSIFPTYFVSRLARRHVTVSLSGDGGDELFGGYETYLAAGLERRYRALPAVLRRGVIEPAVARLKPRSAKKGLVNKAKRFLEGLEGPAAVGHARWRMYLTEASANRLFAPSAAAAMTEPLERHLATLYAQARAGGRGPIDQALHADFGSFLPDDILLKVDRMSMAVSLESRVPYLDKEVVELAFRVPERLKIRNGETKWILKKVAERHVPRQSVYRAKEGFSAPLKQWIGCSHRAMMESLLDEAELARDEIFDAAEVRRLKSEHLAGTRNHAHVLWSLMLFQAWRRRWLAAPARAPRPASALVGVGGA